MNICIYLMAWCYVCQCVYLVAICTHAIIGRGKRIIWTSQAALHAIWIYLSITNTIFQSIFAIFFRSFCSIQFYSRTFFLPFLFNLIWRRGVLTSSFGVVNVSLFFSFSIEVQVEVMKSQISARHLLVQWNDKNGKKICCDNNLLVLCVYAFHLSIMFWVK